MQMLSEDDLNLRDMTREELDAAWDLWFDLAQSTNDADPLYEHGVFVGSVLLYTTQLRLPLEGVEPLTRLKSCIGKNFPLALVLATGLSVAACDIQADGEGGLSFELSTVNGGVRIGRSAKPTT